MKIRLLIVTLVVLVITCCPVFCMWYYSNLNFDREYGIADLIYYTTGILGAFATSFAVIVALFGKEIRAFIFNEHFKLSLMDEGFTENLGTQNDLNPIAQSYDCTLQIKNDGSREISNIQILLKEVYYKPSNNSKYKTIIKYNNKALYWNSPDHFQTQLLLRETKTLPLFKIYPDDSCQTPDRSTYSFLRMRIIGCALDEKFSKQGTWRTVYQLQSNEKVLEKFECIVSWNGTWCNRLTEMADCVNANLKCIGI